VGEPKVQALSKIVLCHVRMSLGVFDTSAVFELICGYWCILKDGHPTRSFATELRQALADWVHLSISLATALNRRWTLEYGPLGEKGGCTS
jgi:hypothetical protein